MKKKKTAYEALLPEIEKSTANVVLENCNYGLWFSDIAFYKKDSREAKAKELYDRIYNVLPEDEKNSFTEESLNKFIKLLFAFNSFLGYTADEQTNYQSLAQEREEISTAKTSALFVTSKSAVTRTSIIVAYYYLYNITHEYDDSDKTKSFEEVFKSFEVNINPILERAFYQPLSGRSLFDVLVVFSSYASLYI
ncbi:MAG: hypothetical protein LUG66_01530 [Clostridiales bacterium]|nr:hypothetical protein [Clostridiales bacterium]